MLPPGALVLSAVGEASGHQAEQHSCPGYYSSQLKPLQEIGGKTGGEEEGQQLGWGWGWGWGGVGTAGSVIWCHTTVQSQLSPNCSQQLSLGPDLDVEGGHAFPHGTRLDLHSLGSATAYSLFTKERKWGLSKSPG